MFGASKPPQSEKTKFSPVSPYGIAKLYGFEIVRAYRKAYSLCAGLLHPVYQQKRTIACRTDRDKTKETDQGTCR